jgi:hypothetical protein
VFDRGPFSVADVRLPAPGENCCPLIVALDGTWHRPFTTLDLAALQGFPVLGDDGILELDREGGASGVRERIGNAVPPPTAAAIGSEMARTLLLEALDTSFALSATEVWVRGIRTAGCTRLVGKAFRVQHRAQKSRIERLDRKSRFFLGFRELTEARSRCTL